MHVIQQAIEHFNLQVVHIEPVDESYSSVVRILTLASGDRRVLKIPFIRRKLQRELHALGQLHGSMPVPQVIDAWQPADGTPGALLMSCLPGQVVTGNLTPAIARQMGELLARLHTHRLPHFGEMFEHPPPPEMGWWEMMVRRFHSWVPLCARVLEPALLERSLGAFERLSADLPGPDGPCLAHFDYRPGNVLARDGRLTGLIDFESSQGGSADLDFVKIKNEVWDQAPDLRQPFLQGYKAIRDLPDIERTLPFYLLGDAFGGVAWCVKRDKLHDPFFDTNLRRLNKILASVPA